MTDAVYQETIRSICQPLMPIATEEDPQLTQLDGIRAVLFDVYGTLFVSASGDIGANSGDHRQQALADTCQLLGVELVDSSEIAIGRFVDAISESHRVAQSKGIEFPEVDIVDVWRQVLASTATGPVENLDFRRFAVEYEVRVNPVWPMPSAADVLTDLSGRGFVLGIVSNAQFFTPLLFPGLMGKRLEEYGFSSQLLYFSYEHRQAKPGNYLYRLASEQLLSERVGPDQVLYLGNDMLNDVAAAASVGFRTALFAGDQRSLRLRERDERTQGVRPDLVITELTQLAECLTTRDS